MKKKADLEARLARDAKWGRTDKPSRRLHPRHRLPRTYRLGPKDDYDVLHPTKGWRHVSAKRAHLYLLYGMK